MKIIFLLAIGGAIATVGQHLSSDIGSFAIGMITGALCVLAGIATEILDA